MIRNFLFHRVSPDRDLLWDPMDVKLFDKCINYINNRYEIITIEDLINDGLDPKKKYATISFDDGYKDNIIYALPILEKYKVKASFYVVTDCIDKNIPTWTYILDYLFQNTSQTKLNLDFTFIKEELKVKEFVTKEAKINYVKKLKPTLKNLAHEERTLVLDRITNSFNDVQLPMLMMDWNDLAQLNKLGHHIGSHTVSHCMLGTMKNDDEIRYELKVSGKLIHNHLGFFPKTISYPVGSYNETTIKLSKEAGYRIGLAVKQDIYFPDKDGIFEIPRIELYNESWLKTKLRISHTLENIKTLIKYR